MHSYWYLGLGEGRISLVLQLLHYIKRETKLTQVENYARQSNFLDIVKEKHILCPNEDIYIYIYKDKKNQEYREY